MKAKATITIKATVTVCVASLDDLVTRIYWKLRRSSFPEIQKSDIKVHQTEVINR